MSVAPKHNPKNPQRFGVQWAVLFMSALLLIAADIADGSAMLADMDDVLRRVQIRDLLSDGTWFDRRLPMIENYDSHWSRWVDLPYVITAKIFGLFMGYDAAFIWASRLVPILLLAGFCGAMVATMRRVNRLAEMPQVNLITLFFVPWIGVIAFLEFAPDRIDHHNMQLLCLVGIVLGLLSIGDHKPGKNRPHWGALTLGLSIILSICIGLETLPLIIVALASLVIAGAFGNPSARAACQWAGATLFLSTVPMTALSTGWRGLTSVSCDAVSAPWVAGLCGGGLLLAVIPRFWTQSEPDYHRVVWRLMVFGAFSIALGASVGAAFPKCLGGPFEMVSPMARDLWLIDIAQEKSVIWAMGYTGYDVQIWLGIFTVSLLGIYGIVFKPHVKTWPIALKILAVLTVASVILSTVQMRHIRMTVLLLAIGFPLAIAQYLARKPFVIRQLRRPINALFMLPVAALLTVHSVTPKVDEIDSARDLLRYDSCEDAALERVAALPAGTLIAPFGLSQSLLRIDHPHTLKAVQFQRASKGIDDVLNLFFSPDELNRRAAVQDVDYLAICRVNTNMDLSESPIYEALNKGQDWPGLTDITLPSAGRLRIYKIEPNF